ncbi:MAG: hypothetical protein DI535_15315 [Citrobacter freundii]|nr:MAG: hypothetical protein DI535_15315 [Citrobacter freundii]
MSQLTMFFRKILSLKYAGLLILIACVMAKSVLIRYYSYIGRDKMYHLSASYNLLHGKGWTNSVYYTNDLQREVNEQFCLWPPGYGLMVAPVEYLLNDDLHLSSDIIEILCFIAFLLLCRGILATQGMSRSWINASTILLTFFSHEFIEVSLGTDLPGLVFMLGYFYAVILLWRTEKTGAGLRLGSIAALCLFMAGFTRYMYVPVAIFVSVIMIVLAWWKGNKRSLPGYGLCLVLSAALLAGAALYQGAVCADPFYIGTDKKSLFPENLAYWHPAALAAFLNLEVYASFLSRFTGISFLSWKMIFNWSNLIVYVFIFIAGLRFLPVIKKATAKGFPVFNVLGFLLSALIIGELAVLSLTNSPKYTLNGTPWTFIIEGRYQAFAIVFLQLFFLLQCSKINWKNIGRSREVVLTGLFILFCLNSIHQFYFSSKVVIGFQQMKSQLTREQDYDFVESYLRALRAENPVKNIFITSSDACYPFMGSVLGAKGIKDYRNAVLVHDKAAQPSTLLVVVMQPELELYRSFINSPGVQLVKEINGTYIYRQEISR